jgi:hypothetical protein
VVVEFATFQASLLAAHGALSQLFEFDFGGECLCISDKFANDRFLELLSYELQRCIVFYLNDLRNNRGVRLSSAESIDRVAD